MNKTKITIILTLLITAFISSRWVKAINEDSSLAQRLKGKILLQVEENGEAWYVFPVDLKRYYLGRPSDAFDLMRDLGLGITNNDLAKISVGEFDYDLVDDDNDGLPNVLEAPFHTDPNKADSDDDGYNDSEEIYNDFNPVGQNKIEIDKELAEKLSGQILIQIEENGEAWYINPDNLKRYYLGQPIDAFNLMRIMGLGITNDNLAKIDKVIVKPELTNEYIVNNYTTPSPGNKRIYNEPNNIYKFEYPANWRIRKFETSPDEIQLTNAERDFIEEKKGVITIHKFSTDDSTNLNNFKIAINNNKVKKIEEKDFNISEKQAFETAYLFPAAFKRTSIIQINDKDFLMISYLAAKDNYSVFEGIYEDLIDSLTITSN